MGHTVFLILPVVDALHVKQMTLAIIAIRVRILKSHLQLSKQTQTDEDWLENLFDELGCRNSNKSPLQKLAKVIELLLDIRSPNPVLLSALPQLVGSFYGTPLNPAEDRNYRKTWREIVRDYCSAEILIAPLPNGEWFQYARTLFLRYMYLFLILVQCCIFGHELITECCKSTSLCLQLFIARVKIYGYG
ncbi:hypothetical protein WUBG_02154 [Wuchereria bancrofti]|uniref:DUF7517 domain-containing protein n=1 Tax=Wuchereria bancrofti TaxID=6293 RepID=J9BHV9_WUCBA|nr:hypothetical protein WUBG_02154 [Wuchereria bancrofti]